MSYGPDTQDQPSQDQPSQYQPSPYQPTRPPVTQYPSRRNPVQAVGLALSIMLVLTGVIWLVSALTSSTSIEEVTLDGDVTALQADLENGDLVVRAGDVDQVELIRTVHRNFTSPDYREEINGTTLHLTGDCPWFAFGRCGVTYELIVPADLITDVDASSGDVVLEGLTGDVVVRSSSGDIVLRSIVGSVDAQVSSGDIVLEGVAGDVVARSSSGDVTADRLTAASVQVRASSGDVEVDLLSSPERLDLESSSGDVTVSVPDDGTSYAVQGESSSGDRRISVATDPASAHRARVHTSSGDATFGYTE